MSSYACTHESEMIVSCFVFLRELKSHKNLYLNLWICGASHTLTANRLLKEATAPSSLRAGWKMDRSAQRDAWSFKNGQLDTQVQVACDRNLCATDEVRKAKDLSLDLSPI